MDVASRVRFSGTSVSKLRRTVIRIVVLALLLAVVGAAAYLIVPGATVTVLLAQQPVRVEVDMVANVNINDIDIDRAVIPATKILVEVETTGTIETTGRQPLPDELALGSVIFINRTGREVEIPAGTTVSTSAGTPIQFRTTQNATLPAGEGQQLEVPIEALVSSSGAAGNVDSGLINTVIGPLENSVNVRNIAPTFGGESRVRPAVTIEDQARLLATVRQQLQAQAYVAMQSNISAVQLLIPETLRIADERSDWKTYSASPGDIADTLTLTMKVVVEALAVDTRLAQQVAFTQIAGQVPRGRVLKPESISYECCPITGVDQDGTIRFKIIGSGTVSGQTNISLLQERLAGRSLEDAARYLSTELDLQPGTQPQIVVSPDWLGQMPLLPIRIELRVFEGQP